ncbi:hypothetical protein [Prescottella subtropica]|uniref:hypothetical protein n=1 Tax=Prescottella subtropica TaxID=2545757 RepID=UPI0010F6E2B4|nr:hypothetical protein [Prescottella subtropica]
MTEPLDWWADTAVAAASVAARRTSNRPGYPTIAHAERIRHGHTSIQNRSINTTVTPVLAVTTDDLDHHTGAAAGQWLTVHALSWGQYPARQRTPGYTTPTVLLILAAICASTAVSGGVDSSSRLTALVAAVMLAPAGAWLLHYRRRRFQDRLWAADSEATTAAGLAAAETILTATAPELYKTAVHTWIGNRRTTTPAGRLRRLHAHADGTHPRLVKP